LHLDVKPSNMLYDGNTSSLYLIDFGNSCKIGKIHIAGTLPYMSPEILLENEEEIGPPSDIWSVGVVFAQWVLHHLDVLTLILFLATWEGHI
jgi:serine/threonine protein kinase